MVTRYEDVFLIDQVIRSALLEDRAFNDITTKSIVPADAGTTAYVIAREQFCLSGMDIFKRVFAMLDREVQVFSPFHDGMIVEAEAKLLTITGRTASILSAERVALNFLSHVCGIATYTYRMVQKLSGSTIKLLDTRKTLPGLRMFEKWAVRDGGGYNHRYNLESGILIKENHICAAGSIAGAIQRIRDSVPPAYTVEIEISNLDEAKEAIAHGADIILVDNLKGKELEEVVAYAHGKVLIEVSGGVDLDNIADYAHLKIDFLSSGAMTMKSRAADMSLLLD